MIQGVRDPYAHLAHGPGREGRVVRKMEKDQTDGALAAKRPLVRKEDRFGTLLPVFVTRQPVCLQIRDGYPRAHEVNPYTVSIRLAPFQHPTYFSRPNHLRHGQSNLGATATAPSAGFPAPLHIHPISTRF